MVGTLPGGGTFSSGARLDSAGSAAIYDWASGTPGWFAGEMHVPAMNSGSLSGAFGWTEAANQNAPGKILDLASALLP
jgi:hypothetical protein